MQAAQRSTRADNAAISEQKPMTLAERRKQVAEDSVASKPIPDRQGPSAAHDHGKGVVEDKYSASILRSELWDSTGSLRALRVRGNIQPNFTPRDGDQFTVKLYVQASKDVIFTPPWYGNKSVTFKVLWGCAIQDEYQDEYPSEPAASQTFMTEPITVDAPSNFESEGVPVTVNITYRDSICKDVLRANEESPRPKPYKGSMPFSIGMAWPITREGEGDGWSGWGGSSFMGFSGAAFPELPLGHTFGSKCGANSASAPSCSGSRGAGVNTATGAFSQGVTDASISGGLPFDVSRNYSSNNPRVGLLGPGWSGSWDAGLKVVASGDATFVGENGSEYTFIRTADGQFTEPTGVDSKLKGTPGGYELTSRGGEIVTFNASGNVTERRDRQQRKLTYSYADGRLSSIRTDTGRTASFGYSGDRIASISLSDGRNVSYRYTSGRLTSFSGLDGKKVDYLYDQSGRLEAAKNSAGSDLIRNVYDSSGRVIEQTMGPLKGKISFSYKGEETDVTMPDGGIWTDIHEKRVLRAQYDPFGNKTSYEYDFKLDPVVTVDPLGNKTITAFDKYGRPVETRGPRTSVRWSYYGGDVSRVSQGNSQWSYEYNDKKQLTEVRSSNRNVARYTYSPSGQMKSVTTANGHQETYEYDEAGNLLSITSPDGARQTRTYDPSGRLQTLTDPRGNQSGSNSAGYTTTYAYDNADRILSVKDAKGGAKVNSYDEFGNLKTVKDPAGRVSVYMYDTANRLISTKSSDGAVVSITYNSMGQVESRTDPIGGKTTYTYDKAGRMVSMTTPRGNAPGGNPDKFTWRYGYDKAGNQTTVSDPDGRTVTTGYDEESRPISITDALGNVSKQKYDASGNVIEAIDALGKVMSSTFDAANNLTAIKDQNGNSISYAYDADGNRTSETSPLGFKTTYTYDPLGREASRTEPRGNVAGADPALFTWRTSYDAAGNVVSETDPLGNNVLSVYDALNNLVERTDPQGKKTSYDYDSLNRPVRTRAPDGGISNATFDISGNLATRTDANQRVTTYEYDKAGRRTKATDPLNRVTQYGYDPDGNRTKVTNARGQTIASTFDSSNLLTSTTYSDGTPKISYTYDNAGRPSTITDGTGIRTIGYDPTGRPLTITAPGSTNPFKYTYRADGAVSSRTYPDGRATSYAYDADGRMTGQTQNGRTTAYGWDTAGNLLSTTVPTTPAITETRTYDQAGRMASISEGAGTRQFVRDGSGRVTTETFKDATTTGLAKRYDYDAAGRLTRACSDTSLLLTCLPGTTGERNTFDKVGNRLSATTGATTTNNVFDAADQMTSSTTGTAVTDMTYDADGNLAKDGAGTYSYDALGRAKTTTIGADTFTFVYDADGNRTTTKKNGAPIRSHQWDVNNSIPRIATDLSQSSGWLLGDYHYGPLGEPQAVDTGAASFYYLHDRQNSITSVRDLSGVENYKYGYGTWGTFTGTAGGGAQQASVFGFTGTFKDQVSRGRIDLPARGYDPKAGRFTSPDPRPDTASPANSSTYAYANNDPVNQSDPSGACPLCISAGIGAAIGAAVEGGIYSWQHRNGGFTASGLGKSALRGAVVGGVSGLLMPGAGNLAARSFGLTGGRALATSTAVNAGVGAGFSYAVNEVNCRPTDPWDLLLGATGGASSALVGPAFNLIRQLRGKLANPMPGVNVPQKSIVAPKRVFRGDGRDPRIIFPGGFQAEPFNDSFDLLRYGWYNEGTRTVVGTSKHAKLAMQFPQRNHGSTWVYEIDAPGVGIDMNKALGRSYVFKSEKEIIFPGGIDGSRIIRAVRWSWGTPTSEVVENPGYLPR
ncbi:DUF6531 domain-containing protein [Streptomyces sp. NPDC059496]|uniref:scabin-related ADP-ribosyltransferase n=1 Tax=Streptomyces sp. NPDC059496 TaxID=3346851 RepID=UPI0036BA221A